MAKFKHRAPSFGAENDDVTGSFVRYVAIVDSFIKYDSHSEINISSDTKRDVMKYITFEEYFQLVPVSGGSSFPDGLGSPT